MDKTGGCCYGVSLFALCLVSLPDGQKFIIRFKKDLSLTTEDENDAAS